CLGADGNHDGCGRDWIWRRTQARLGRIRQTLCHSHVRRANQSRKRSTRLKTTPQRIDGRCFLLDESPIARRQETYRKLCGDRMEYRLSGGQFCKMADEFSPPSPQGPNRGLGIALPFGSADSGLWEKGHFLLARRTGPVGSGSIDERKADASG